MHCKDYAHHPYHEMVQVLGRLPRIFPPRPGVDCVMTTIACLLYITMSAAMRFFNYYVAHQKAYKYWHIALYIAGTKMKFTSY